MNTIISIGSGLTILSHDIIQRYAITQFDISVVQRLERNGKHRQCRRTIVAIRKLRNKGPSVRKCLLHTE